MTEYYEKLEGLLPNTEDLRAFLAWRATQLEASIQANSKPPSQTEIISAIQTTKFDDLGSVMLLGSKVWATGAPDIPLFASPAYAAALRPTVRVLEIAFPSVDKDPSAASRPPT